MTELLQIGTLVLLENINPTVVAIVISIAVVVSMAMFIAAVRRQ